MKFVCLSSTLATTPPSSVKDKTELCNAGLGDSSMVLDLNESTTYCHEKIIERYQKLDGAGGYELLLFQRGGGDGGGFHVIKPPHTSKRLKDICGQAKIYIRPLQKDIDCLNSGVPHLETMEVQYSTVSHCSLSPAC